MKTIRFEVDQRGVGTITLMRPDKHNAMDAKMIEELSHTCDRIAGEHSIRVCVLQGEGKSFCAGGDLDWMAEQMKETREEKIVSAMQLAQMLQKLDDLPCPLIGKVQGPAYGGGIGLMSVCDIVISGENNKFVLSETKLGLIPATIGPFVIRRIGEAWARQYFFTGKMFETKVAQAMHLVSQSVPINGLEESVETEIAQILGCKPGAVADAKSLAKHLARNPDLDSQSFTAEKLADRWEDPEAKRAINAFLNARK